MKKILIINGPNINFTGIRETEIYGNELYSQICEYIKSNFIDIDIDTVQSNIEGEIVDFIQKAYAENYSAIVINPGAYTHYSYAIADALKSIKIPSVEVHLSNIYSREEFRQKSVTAASCKGVISGFGKDGYIMAIEYLKNSIF